MWNALRRSKLLVKIWEKTEAPPKVKETHFKRALLNIFLFVYAPLTQSAVQMMICVETCTGGAECVRVMEIDYSMRCDSADVQGGMVPAAVGGILVCALFLLLFMKGERVSGN